MLHCACTEDIGTSVGHLVPVSVSRTYRYVVALSEVLHRSCKKCACVCISFNVISIKKKPQKLQENVCEREHVSMLSEVAAWQQVVNT